MMALLGLLAGAAAGNPIVMDYYLSEFSTDPDTAQWVELNGTDRLPGDLNGWRLRTSTSECTLSCRVDRFVVIDSTGLANGTVGRGKLRLNPTGDFIELSGPGYFERVAYPVSPSCTEASPAPPRHCSACRWEPVDDFAGTPSIWYIDSTPTPGGLNNDYSSFGGRVYGLPANWMGKIIVTASGKDCHSERWLMDGDEYDIAVLPGRYQLSVSGSYGDHAVERVVYPESVDANRRVDLNTIDSRWGLEQDLPASGKKGVKGGGCIAAYDFGPEPGIYALRGNHTSDVALWVSQVVWPTTVHWRGAEPLPGSSHGGRAKPVGDGGALVRAGNKLYVLKGNSTFQFLSYDPGAGWQQLEDVPAGESKVKAGAGLATCSVADSECVFMMKGRGSLEFYRYSPASGHWTTMRALPSGHPKRHYPSGSALCSDGQTRVFALEAGVNAFFSYDVTLDAWTRLPDLPLVNKAGRTKKVGSGGALTFLAGNVYALKGGSTVEFWLYDTTAKAWSQEDDLPMGWGKTKRKVGAGGSLAAFEGRIYALKGNNTLGFMSHDTADNVGGHHAAAIRADPNPQPRRAAAGLELTPNPFRSYVRLSYQSPGPGFVRLVIADAAGRNIRLLSSGQQSAGLHATTWDRRDNQGRLVAPGVYLVRFESANRSEACKIVVTR